MIGQRFGQLTVVRRAENGAGNRSRWVCVCECGAEITVSGTSIRYQKGARSCGKHRSEQSLKRMGAAHVTHGMDGTAEYRAWINMRGRCENPGHKAYPLYGGRGITVCHEWSDFPRFFSDMGIRPSNKHSLDRIDVNAGYSRENCRWATTTQQARNTRRVRYIEMNGVVGLLAEAAERTGLSKSTLWHRAAHQQHGVRFVDPPLQTPNANRDNTLAGVGQLAERGLAQVDYPAQPLRRPSVSNGHHD